MLHLDKFYSTHTPFMEENMNFFLDDQELMGSIYELIHI